MQEDSGNKGKFNNIYNTTQYDTDPPMMARNGRSGCSRALAKYVNSFFSRKPDARCGSWQPTIELQQPTENY